MIGCLCIHGFTGNPAEIEPLVQYLSQHTEWLISVPTLPGHGEVLNLRGVGYEQWIDYAERELQKLLQTCDSVYVVGFSMGGMIASYLAVHYPVKKLILLSAAAYYVSPKQLATDILEMIKDALGGRLSENELFERYKRKIKETPLAATLQFRKLVASIKPLLDKVTVPTLIAQGECDGVVPPKSAQYLYEHIGTTQKKLVYFKNSKHRICHCNENEELFSEVITFLDGRDSTP